MESCDLNKINSGKKFVMDVSNIGHEIPGIGCIIHYIQAYHDHSNLNKFNSLNKNRDLWMGYTLNLVIFFVIDKSLEVPKLYEKISLIVEE